MPWQWPVGALFAFVLAVMSTPAGVSGAVLLLPLQLSVLHVPSPAVTPTNLLFNVAATPGGLLRFWQENRLRGPLTRVLVLGTLPGVIAGAVIRVGTTPTSPPGAIDPPAARTDRVPDRRPVHPRRHPTPPHVGVPAGRHRPLSSHPGYIARDGAPKARRGVGQTIPRVSGRSASSDIPC
jgi:hypothetical protein